MNDAAEQLPDDLASALAALAAERVRRITAESEAATAKAEAASAKALVSHSEAPVARLKLEIEKVRRELFGSRFERKARLLKQMELQFEELEADAGEDELAAEIAANASIVKAFEPKRPSRKPFPEHLPRERAVLLLRQTAPAAARRSCRSSVRKSQRHWRSSLVSGRSFRPSGRSSPAASARRLRSHQHPSM